MPKDMHREERAFQRQSHPITYIIILSLASPFIFGISLIFLLRSIEFIAGTVSYSAALISCAISIAVSIVYLIKIGSFGLTKVIFTKNGLTIKSLFTRRQFSWGELEEFGRIVRPVDSDAVVRNWDYYVKVAHVKKRIFISNSEVKDAPFMCHLLSQYAPQVTFVTMFRRPLTLTYEAQPWSKTEILQAWEDNERRKDNGGNVQRGTKLNIGKIIKREALIVFLVAVLAFFIGAFLPVIDAHVAGDQFSRDPGRIILSQHPRWELIKLTEILLVLILYPISLIVRFFLWMFGVKIK